MTQKPKMICPKCGVEMNHHAIKIDFTTEIDDKFDPVFGGILEEVHTCPKCGKTELRKF